MKQNDLFLKLVSNKEKEVSSDVVQHIVKEIIAFAHGNVQSELFGTYENYCRTIIDTYSNDYLKAIFNTKHGVNASDFIVNAFIYYIDNADSMSK